MKEIWIRLERWLEEEAPEILSDLNAGATEAEIAALEEATGLQLPSDLKESLNIHNGQNGEGQWLFAGWEFLSTERILDEWKVWKELYDKKSFDSWDVDAESGIANEWWNPAWIPITYNGSGDHHCIDLSPTKDGTIGQVITMWHDSDERRIVASSYRQWLELIVAKFEANDSEYVFDSGDFEFI
ncbi:SMI1/KNR4 family protein [Cohnella faecalis]|uniref:Molybdenum cofactor biosynthesis protein MoeA n=1 Tax=Cohnella faecalis TaxID=2315694 RepID=A0A398CJD8_9BACL|nr:SMI1/KNR4 family protein [Cohnella faecalis]RIE02465.1 molybdenum cofactor biosynthesis protein MoeA [Cohnella faecalis]